MHDAYLTHIITGFSEHSSVLLTYYELDICN